MVQNTARNKIIRGIGWKYGERLFSQGVSFVVSLVLARLLSPNDYGIIALVMVFINLSSVFITSGFASALIQKKDADNVDFSTMFYCSLVCSIGIYLIIFVVAPYIARFYHESLLVDVLRVFALQIPLSSYNAIQNAYVSRHMLFKKSFFATILGTSFSGIVGICLALIGLGVWALVFQSIAAVIINTLILIAILPWYPKICFSFSSAKKMLKYSSNILMADLSGTFFGELRSLVIGRAYTGADLAFYSKGQQLPQLVTGNLGTAVSAVLFPAMSNESDDIARVKHIMKRSLCLLSYIVFPALLGLASIMEPLVIILYTEKWAECIPYAQVLCVGFSFGILGIASLQPLKAIGRSDIVLFLEFWKKPIYLILLFVGVKINVFAVAVTMAIYDVYGFFVNTVLLKKYLGYQIRDQLIDVFVPFFLSCIMVFIVGIIPLFSSLFFTLFVKIFVGIIFYIVISSVCKMDSFLYLKSMVLGIIKR